MRPAPYRSLLWLVASVVLAMSSLYIGFDAASPHGFKAWDRLSELLFPSAKTEASPSVGNEFVGSQGSDLAESPSLSPLPHRGGRAGAEASPFAWPASEGVGGLGIHRAVRRQGVWFPVYSPGMEGGEAATDEAEKSVVPLYITSGTPPRTPVDAPLNYAFEAIGGRPPYRWRMVLGVKGFSIDAASGLFTGSSAEALQLPLAIHVTDAEGAEDSALYTLRIGEEMPLRILTESLPVGVPGEAYLAELQAEGGQPPYKWSLDASLPEGLEFDGTKGQFRGYLATAHEQELEIRVSDQEGTEMTQSLTLRFPSVIEITTPARLPPAAPGAATELQFEAKGGQPPYEWRLVSGQLPLGPEGVWGLAPEGILTGMAPLQDSVFQFALEAVDGMGNRAQKAFQLPVRNALLVVPSFQKAGLAWRPREIARSLGIVPQAFTVTRSFNAEGDGPRVVYQGLGHNFVDHGLATGTTYYYTLHVHTGDGNSLPFATSATTLRPFSKTLREPLQRADPYADAVLSFRPLSRGGHGESFLPLNVLGPPDGKGTFAPASDPSQVLSLHASTGSLGAPLDGHGGAVVLAFEDNLVWNGPGEDFTVFENVFFVNGDANRRFMEPAIVSVALFEDEWHRFPIDVVPPATTSSTPATMDPFYYNRGFAGRNATTGGDPTDPRQSGGDSFDLADLRRSGLTWIRFIKIQSTGHQVLRDDFGGHPVQHMESLGAASGGGASGFDLDAVSAVNY